MTEEENKIKTLEDRVQQHLWERDVAIKQINDIGAVFGQNMKSWKEKHDSIVEIATIEKLRNAIILHLNDYALQEIPFYQDDLANQRNIYMAIRNCMSGVEEIAEKMIKEIKKYE